MDQGDECADGHSPFEVDSQEDRDQRQEDNEPLEGLGRYLRPPRRSDHLNGDLRRRDTADAAQGLRQLDGLRAGQRNRLDPHGARTGDGHDRLPAGLGLGYFSRLGHRAGRIGDGEVGTAAELNPEIQSSEGKRSHGDEQDDRRKDVPPLPPTDEVVGNLTAIEPLADVGDAAHDRTSVVSSAESPAESSAESSAAVSPCVASSGVALW